MPIRQFIKRKKEKRNKKILQRAGLKVSDLANIASNREILFEEKAKLNSVHIHPVDTDDKSFSPDLPLLIGFRTYFTSGTVRHLESIGRYCSVADNVSIGAAQHPVNWLSSHPFQYSQYHNSEADHFFESGKAPTVIGNDVWIGGNVVINAGVHVGDGAIIAAGSIVAHDVPPYSIYGGVPACLIRKRFSDSVIKRLLDIQWWDYAEKSLIGLPFDDVVNCIDLMEERVASGKMAKQDFEIKKLSNIILR